MPIFHLFLVLSWKLEGNFFHFFQCSPRDLSLSLMRPASHSEFETPALIRIHDANQNWLVLFSYLKRKTNIDYLTKLITRKRAKRNYKWRMRKCDGFPARCLSNAITSRTNKGVSGGGGLQPTCKNKGTIVFDSLEDNMHQN